ncbi:MAG TPA: hypothetical protein VJL29_04315 [Thermoguttaceae bacterium]|nr:hypothetical protein [Thermoguttaceae bacterium]
MAKQYRVEVTMSAGPFAFDCSEPTVLKRSDLEKRIEQSGGRAKKVKKTEKKTTEKKPEEKEKK